MMARIMIIIITMGCELKMQNVEREKQRKNDKERSG
jgi:hypothetical protein